MAPNPRNYVKSTKKTILIVGEGPTEKAFLQHIQALYIMRDCALVVKVESGSGGSPRSVIEKTVRLRGSRAYDQCFILLDKDKPIEIDKTLEKRIKQKPCIKILEATPCIEGLFLAILKFPNFSQSTAQSTICKKEFEQVYIRANKKTDKRSYATVFPRTMIEGCRNGVLELNCILEAMGIS